MARPLKGESGTYYLRPMIHGRQREYSLRTKKKSEAETKAAQFTLTLQNKGLDAALAGLRGKHKGDNPTFDEISALYRDFAENSDKPLRPRTVRVNLTSLRRIFRETGSERLREITTSKMRAALRPNDPKAHELTTYTSLVRNAGSVFSKRALKYYADRGSRIECPFDRSEIGSPQIEPYSPLAPELRNRLLTECETELAPAEAMAVLLALGAGLRRAEIEAARMHWFRISDQGANISVQREKGFLPKSGEKRVVPIRRELYDRLLELRGSDEAGVFLPRKGKNLEHEFRRVTAWLRQQGVTDSKPLHSLRKEAGSLICEQQDIVAAQRFLGHANITVTEKHYIGKRVKALVLEENSERAELLALIDQSPHVLRSALKAARKASKKK